MKALIVIDNLYTGGIATSFLNFLNIFVNYADCDILVFNGVIPDKSQIPQTVKILPTNNRLLLLGSSQSEIKSKHWFLALIRVCFVLLARLSSGYFSRKILFAAYKMSSNYDIAISYTHDDKWNTFSRGCNQFVLSCINAKEKASFVHCDFSKFEGFNLKYEKIYNRFNHIVCVSESCCKSFISCFPLLKEKCITIENFINEERIIELSKNPFMYDTGVINIISICRISKEKGLFRTVSVFKRLKNEHLTNFHWTIVGGGGLLAELKSIICKYKLDEYITLVGEQDNPYKYLVNADLFLLPSYHEAAPMVFGECNVLGIPILSTETVSARELVANRSVGIVCENSEEGLYISLKKIIEDNGLINEYNKPHSVNSFAKASLEAYLNILKKNENNCCNHVTLQE